MPERKNVEEQVKKYTDIEVLYESEGGKRLADTLKSDIATNIASLIYNFPTMSHIELVSVCANLKTNTNMLRALKNAKDNKEELEALLLTFVDENI